MPNANNISRRQFIKKAGTITTAFTFVPRYVLGGAGHVAPSEKINVALVGVGGQGKYHVSTFLDEPDVNVVAVCDVFKVCNYDKWYYGGYGNNPRIIPETKMKAYKLPPKTIPRVNGSHERNWLDACKGGEPAVSNFEYASKLTEAVLLGNVAIRAGEKLDWDAENIKVSNVPDANRFVHREYRDGWTL